MLQASISGWSKPRSQRDQKTELWERLRRENREGIVFKRLDAPYTPGKPNSGGPQLKFKFVATVSAIVAKMNAKRSVEVSLFKGRSLISCGNVTIPANHEIPKVGAVVEVRYLYAYPGQPCPVSAGVSRAA